MSINWFLLRRVTRALWFLPALFSVFAILVVAIAYFSPYFFPNGLNADQLPVTVSTQAVRNVMAIVASSMLAVAVFSLSTLVNLLSSASNLTSPRAVSLIVEDRTAQTSISVFIGAFLFSIVGIIGLSGEIYSTSGRLILFAATVIVALAVVWALIRWIGHISVVGRVGETIARVEHATGKALARVAPTTEINRPVAPPSAVCIHAGAVGFVQHFDREALQKLAEGADLTIHVLARPGTYVDYGACLAIMSGPADERCRKEIRGAFHVGHERTFEYDPGFGLTVLAEIGQRALSPALNDPGTAIQIVTAQTRLLGNWARRPQDGKNGSEHDRVFVASIFPAELLAQSLQPVARDAAGSVDVTMAVLRGLRTLVEAAPADFGPPALLLAQEIAERAALAMNYPGDIKLVADAAATVGDTTQS